MSSSLTILMTCCAGFSAWETSSPRARSLIAAMNVRTTGQRDVGLEQRDADLASGGVDVVVGQPALAAQDEKTLSSRLERVSNTVIPSTRTAGRAWLATPRVRGRVAHAASHRDHPYRTVINARSVARDQIALLITGMRAGQSTPLPPST